MSSFAGRIRVKLLASLNGFSYRTTIFSTGGCLGIPVRKEIHQKTDLEFCKAFDVVVEEDTAERTVTLPLDLAKLLKTEKLTSVFKDLNYTRQKEHVQSIESIKRPETPKKRLEKIVHELK